MMFRQGKDAKYVDKEWHERRQLARKTTFSIGEWSEQEITRWDLETAGITGRDNPRTYKIERAIDTLGENGFDIRDLPDR